MTLDELIRKVLDILPDAIFDEIDGELVIYTQLSERRPGANLTESKDN